MSYQLFFYNLTITFITVFCIGAYSLIAKREHSKTHGFVAALFTLYLIDILILFMADSVPDFGVAFGRFIAVMPDVYIVLDLAILLAYRMILSGIFRQPLHNLEAAFWVLMSVGAIASLAIPNTVAYITAQCLFLLALQMRLVFYGFAALKQQRQTFTRKEQLGLTTLFGAMFIYAFVQIGVNIIELYGSTTSVRQLPEELLGLCYSLAALAYLWQRSVQRNELLKAAAVSMAAVNYGLTKRETEILELLNAGCTNKEISERMVISPNTTKTHVHHIFEKLHIGSRENLPDFFQAEYRNAKDRLPL